MRSGEDFVVAFAVIPIASSLEVTYNSPRRAVLEAVQRGVLYWLDPVLESDPVCRVMVLHPELHVLFQAEPMDGRIGKLRSDLESFVVGHELSLSFTPFRHQSAYMGVLDPEREGVWEIRSTDPNPGMRVFGCFADKDVFVALGWSLRSLSDPRWPSKSPLRKRDSMEYQYAQIEVLERWKTTMLGFAPLTGNDPSEYLSEKYHQV